jgi:hypothetical protein
LSPAVAGLLSATRSGVELAAPRGGFGRVGSDFVELDEALEGLGEAQAPWAGMLASRSFRPRYPARRIGSASASFF